MAKAAQAPKSVASALPPQPERRGRRPAASGAAKEARSPNDMENEPTEEQMAAEVDRKRDVASWLDGGLVEHGDIETALVERAHQRRPVGGEPGPRWGRLRWSWADSGGGGQADPQDPRDLR